MNRQDKTQLVWAASFVLSGIILGFAIWMIPVIGLLTTASFIVIYIGISSAFLFIFREIENVRSETLEKLKERREEIIEIQKAIAGKFYNRKIDQQSFRRIMEDYETKLKELEVKIKKLEKKK